jgi:hypothetical protein
VRGLYSDAEDRDVWWSLLRTAVNYLFR